jgi:hypothetical protein
MVQMNGMEKLARFGLYLLDIIDSKGTFPLDMLCVSFHKYCHKHETRTTASSGDHIWFQTSFSSPMGRYHMYEVAACYLDWHIKMACKDTRMTPAQLHKFLSDGIRQAGELNTNHLMAVPALIGSVWDWSVVLEPCIPTKLCMTFKNKFLTKVKYPNATTDQIRLSVKQAVKNLHCNILYTENALCEALRDATDGSSGREGTMDTHLCYAQWYVIVPISTNSVQADCQCKVYKKSQGMYSLQRPSNYTIAKNAERTLQQPIIGDYLGVFQWHHVQYSRESYKEIICSFYNDCDHNDFSYLQQLYISKTKKEECMDKVEKKAFVLYLKTKNLSTLDLPKTYDTRAYKESLIWEGKLDPISTSIPRKKTRVTSSTSLTFCDLLKSRGLQPYTLVDIPQRKEWGGQFAESFPQIFTTKILITNLCICFLDF